MSKTFGEQFDSALKCKTKEEAFEWMKKEIEEFMARPDWKKSYDETWRLIKSNIGYMAGYYDDATAKKIHMLFGAVHPLFGTATYHEDIRPEDAFIIGQNLGELLKK